MLLCKKYYWSTVRRCSKRLHFPSSACIEGVLTVWIIGQSGLMIQCCRRQQIKMYSATSRDFNFAYRGQLLQSVRGDSNLKKSDPKVFRDVASLCQCFHNGDTSECLGACLELFQMAPCATKCSECFRMSRCCQTHVDSAKVHKSVRTLHSF